MRNLSTALTVAGAVGCRGRRAPARREQLTRPEHRRTPKSGTSSEIMRCTRYLAPAAASLGVTSRIGATSRNRGHHGNATTAPNRRNANRSAAGRAWAVGARSPPCLHRTRGVDPRCGLVRVLPHMSWRRRDRSLALRLMLLARVMPRSAGIDISFVRCPTQTQIIHKTTSISGGNNTLHRASAMPRWRIGLVVKLGQYVFRRDGEYTSMRLHLSDGCAERSRIEDGIREYEFSLLRIDEERIQLAVGLAECNLIRRLLVVRQHTPRAKSRNLTRSRSRAVPQRSLNQRS